MLSTTVRAGFNKLETLQLPDSLKLSFRNLPGILSVLGVLKWCEVCVCACVHVLHKSGQCEMMCYFEKFVDFEA